jgi:hypothetical protein
MKKNQCASCAEFVPFSISAVPGDGRCVLLKKMVNKKMSCEAYKQKNDRSAIKIREREKRMFEENSL